MCFSVTVGQLLLATNYILKISIISFDISFLISFFLLRYLCTTGQLTWCAKILRNVPALFKFALQSPLQSRRFHWIAFLWRMKWNLLAYWNGKGIERFSSEWHNMRRYKRQLFYVLINGEWWCWSAECVLNSIQMGSDPMLFLLWSIDLWVKLLHGRRRWMLGLWRADWRKVVYLWSRRITI